MVYVSYTFHLIQNIFHDRQERGRRTSVETPLLAEGVIVVVEIQHDVLLVRQAFRSSAGAVITHSTLSPAALRLFSEAKVQSQKPGGKKAIQMLRVSKEANETAV